MSMRMSPDMYGSMDATGGGSFIYGYEDFDDGATMLVRGGISTGCCDLHY